MMNRPISINVAPMTAALLAAALAAATPALAQPAALMREGQPVVLSPGYAPGPGPMAMAPGAPVGGGALYQIYEQAAAQGRGQMPYQPYAPPAPYGYAPQAYAPIGYGDGPPPLGANGWRSGYYGDPADQYCRPSSGRGATIGALSGAALGFGLSNRRERGVGTLIGGIVGGLTGAAIERGNRCR